VALSGLYDVSNEIVANTEGTSPLEKKRHLVESLSAYEK
jgi:hypothetical protein